MFNLYPYTDFHELNLDMILRLMKDLHKEWTDFEAVNKITNAGAWDITKQYQAWTVVSDNNIGYISLKPVPVGVAITNIEYWGVIADYNILITNLSARISALENKLLEFAYLPEDFGAVGDGVTDDSAAIQSALDAAVTDGVGCVAFNGKTYKVNSDLRVDVGKVSLYGNNSTIDMSSATGGLILSNTNGTPYKTANKCIYGLEFIGNSNIDCITISAGAPGEAVSHLKIVNCNIHEFRYGFVCQDYCYLITFIGTDFYNCTNCIRILNGTDSGENISLIACCLYNSTVAIYNASQNSAVHSNNSSFDYNVTTLESTVENRNYFINCHIEGPGKIIGWGVFEGCWIMLNGAIQWFDVSNNAIQRYTHCFMHTPNAFNDAAVGNGHIYFTEIEDNNISDFATCEFNGLANTNEPKPGNIWGSGTAQGTTPWNATNAAVSTDSGEYETGSYSYKLEKIYGAGSASEFRILMPRNPKSTHYQIKIRVKTATPTTLIIGSRLTAMPELSKSDGTPFFIAEEHDARSSSTPTTGDWETFTIYGNTRFVADDNAYLITLSLYSSAANSLYLDRIEIVEF